MMLGTSFQIAFLIVTRFAASPLLHANPGRETPNGLTSKRDGYTCCGIHSASDSDCTDPHLPYLYLLLGVYWWGWESMIFVTAARRTTAMSARDC
jgi:hypothetical protein